MRHALWWRIGSLLFIVQIAVLGLLVFLNYSNYRSHFESLQLNRFLVIGKDIQQTVEAGLDVGLAPEENIQLSSALAIIRQRETDLHYVAVTNSQGKVLAESGVSTIFFQQPTQSAHQSQDSKNRADYWGDEQTSLFRLGLPLVNNFNVVSGEVLLGYDKRPSQTAIHTMLMELLQDAVLCATFFGLLTWLGCYVLLGRHHRELVKLEQQLQENLIKLEHPQDIRLQHLSSLGIPHSLEDDAHVFITQYQEIDRQLQQWQEQLLIEELQQQAFTSKPPSDSEHKGST